MSRSLEQVLSGMLKEAVPAAPRVGWEQRALEAMAQTTPRGRAGRRVAWWKLAPVGIVVAMLLPAAAWWLPRRGSFALADVARATAHVRSAHYVGWELDPSGGREAKEGWIEPRRARMTEGGAIDEYYDESRFVEIRTEDGHVQVTIDPLPDDLAKLLGEGGGYVHRLLWPQAAQEALDRRGETLAGWERQRLPDGRRVVVADLTAGDRTTRMTVDERTDLIMWAQSYQGGKLVGEIGPIEYNVDIPEEVFHVSIPEGAAVVDNNAEPNSLLAKGNTPPGEVMLLHAPAGGRFGSCGSPFHTHLRFEVVGNEAAGVSYVPERNSYRVVGKVRITGDGLDVTVESREYVMPFPPDVTLEQYKAEEARRQAEAERRMPPPEVQRWREARREELAAAGAQSLGMCDGMLAVGGYRFDMLNDRTIEVWYERSTNAFYVMGKAHLTGHGTDQVVEDGWVKVSGPPLSSREFR
jgi:hypothetical protein